MHEQILDFSNLSPEAIQALLAAHQLRLSVDEALHIQHQLLRRPPTLAECVLWSIQGSEHCSYKSTRHHLSQFLTEGPHVILGPKEDAGVVAVATSYAGHRYGVVISHESHNHPSQIVPYEGAATGVGGNVRDVCCMGAEVIGVADSLRFGDINQSKTHYIQQGVVAGIGGYGNPLGIPNIAGDIYFDAGYNENCLVTVVTLGIVREDHLIHSKAPPDAEEHLFILVGKPTDNSGFGGASFASTNLVEEEKDSNKGAVQEPNAFLQRHLLKANYALFDYLKENHLLQEVGFKDLGAGGVACASVELAEAGGYGAEINLDQVPTSMPLTAAVALCAETQERFMWVVPPRLVDTVLSHYNETFGLPMVSEGAKAAVVGKLRTDGMYVVTTNNQEIVRAKAADITRGLRYDRAFEEKKATQKEPDLELPRDYNAILLNLLSHENIASRAPIYETYDKQVQGRTHFEAGTADAGVLQPFNDDSYPEEIRQVGVALSLDHNPRLNRLDPYWGAISAVIESVRNVTAVGATPVAITDCLCFGNPEIPARMFEFVQAVRGIKDACAAVTLKDHPEHSLPVVSGNVSLYNETQLGSIPPSPMISCLGAIPDVAQAITYDLKRTDSVLILIGDRQDAGGGSVYYQLHGDLGANFPRPDLNTFANEIHAVTTAIQAGLVLAAHDIADGGIAVALAEMSFKNNIGLDVDIPGDVRLDLRLFGETGGFVLEVARDKMNVFRNVMFQYQISFAVLGNTMTVPRLRMNQVIDLAITEAKHAWLNGLREKLL